MTTPNRKPIRYKDDVFVPALFQSQKLYRFSMRELSLLRALGETQDLEQAAAIAGCTPEQAIRTLKKKEIREFLNNRLNEIAIHRGWTVERWFHEGEAVWAGKKAVSREQMEVWKEFGARISPKTERMQMDVPEGEMVFMVRKRKS